MIAKLLQIMMACAIFNPFCCCTAGVLSAEEIETAPMDHGCCQAATASTGTAPANSKEPHDPDTCPHKVLKESQATSLKDGAGIHFASQQLPLILTLLQVITFEPVAQIIPRAQTATVSQAPPLALTQRHCVYRI